MYVCVRIQQGWPAGTQQILIPSTWQQMPGMAIHNPGQAVVPDSPMGAPVSDSQQASGWRWVESNGTLCLHAEFKRHSLRSSCSVFIGVVMEASTMASASRTLVLGVTLPPKATTQGPLTQEPNRARGQRLDMQRAEPGILLDRRTFIPSTCCSGEGASINRSVGGSTPGFSCSKCPWARHKGCCGFH